MTSGIKKNLILRGILKRELRSNGRLQITPSQTDTQGYLISTPFLLSGSIVWQMMSRSLKINKFLAEKWEWRKDRYARFSHSGYLDRITEKEKREDISNVASPIVSFTSMRIVGLCLRHTVRRIFKWVSFVHEVCVAERCPCCGWKFHWLSHALVEPRSHVVVPLSSSYINLRRLICTVRIIECGAMIFFMKTLNFVSVYGKSHSLGDISKHVVSWTWE